MKFHARSRLILLALPLLSGCETLAELPAELMPNRVTCTVARDKAYFVGILRLSAEVHFLDAAEICKSPAPPPAAPK